MSTPEVPQPPAGAGEPAPAAEPVAETTGQQISLAQIEEQSFPTPWATPPLPPLQKIGYKLALFVFFLICSTTILILAISFWRTPVAAPPGPLTVFDEKSVDQYERAVNLYKQIGDIPLQRAKDLFQLFVITAFLPSFAAILGYIFGSQPRPQSTPPADKS